MHSLASIESGSSEWPPQVGNSLKRVLGGRVELKHNNFVFSTTADLTRTSRRARERKEKIGAAREATADTNRNTASNTLGEKCISPNWRKVVAAK